MHATMQSAANEKSLIFIDGYGSRLLSPSAGLTWRQARSVAENMKSEHRCSNRHETSKAIICTPNSLSRGQCWPQVGSRKSEVSVPSSETAHGFMPMFGLRLSGLFRISEFGFRSSQAIARRSKRQSNS